LQRSETQTSQSTTSSWKQLQGVGLGVRNNQAKQFQQAEQHSGLGLVGTDLTYPHFYKTLRHPTGTTYRRGNS